MNKKEYIAKIEQLIYNKIKYHAPNLENEQIDLELLKVVGIDTSLPVFIYKKPLDKIFFHAFKKAKKRVGFNLVLTQKPLIKKTKINKLPQTFLFLPDEISESLYYSLDALNINYSAHSSYKIKYNKQFLAINNKEVEFSYLPYYNYKKYSENGTSFEIKEFLCNGRNFIINLINLEKHCSKVKIELNLPLPRGYYFFKKSNECVEIKNLFNQDKAYFNYYCKNAKFNFANVDGLDFSSFACINFETEINLLPKEQRKLYFNYGDKKYCIKNSLEMNDFFEISQQKMFQIFDLQVKTTNYKFDEFFNRSLPRNIWEKWQKNGYDEESEKEWLKIRNSILKKFENGEQINENFKGLKEASLYRNQRWKRIFIIHNGSRYMFADNTRYFNFMLLTNEIFKKNNEIYLSFEK